MKIAIVILNWNGRHMLERFLPSVTLHCPTDAEVIVADNGSTDDSLYFLETYYPSLRVIRLDKNYGFAEGYNRALAQIDADYYVLLNDDVEVTPNWITPVISQMEQGDQIALAQPKMLMYEQRDTFEYAGGAGGFIDKYGYPMCRGRMFATLEQDCGQYDDSCEIFWASGAAMFVKAEVWKELGGLDGDFFAHMEEIDFCWRAKNAGYKAVYCPQSVIYHVGGGTLPKSSPRKTFLNFRNNMALLYKNLPQHRLHWVMALRMVLDGVAGLKFLLEGHPKECLAVIKAHQAYRRWKPQLREKRSRTQPREVDCVYNGHLLIDYYLLGKKRFSQLKFK
ncbi:MAG: glycosyltransferase family 2 protein [Bacteroidales bacterium]|nr:glycosyltransferase family 2 protein [Bacteroidales bacterium]